MKIPSLFLVFSVYLVGFVGFIYAQISARNTVPETVASCYLNTTAYNRFTRLPMHMDNLIAIIRKIEQKNPLWDMRQITRTLVNRYTFDGIYYNPLAKPEFAFIPDPEEAAKTEIVKLFIPIPPEEMFPSGTLDNDEMCALHWMLSHSMNSTVRDEELRFNPYNPSYPQGSSYDTSFNYNSNNNNNNNQYSSQNRWKRELENNDVVATSTSDETDSPDLSNEEDSKHEPALTLKDLKEASQENDDSAEGPQDEIKPSVVVPILRGRSLPQDGVPDSPKSARQVSTNDPGKTRRPIETGVVYTRWGAVSAGRLIAGIAAALEGTVIPVNGFGSPYPSQPYGSNGGSNGYPTPNIPNPNQGYQPPGGSGSGYPPNPNYNSNPNPFGTGNTGGSVNPPQSGYGSKNQWAGRRKRQTGINLQALENVFAATIAGDVGQSAILNGKNNIPSSVAPPKGIWNDTGCPREYILEQHPDPTKEIFDPSASWSFLTEAEVRGGMDGLILSSKLGQIDPARNMKLSDILSLYYSEIGITEGASTTTAYRACDRGTYFSGMDSAKLQEQSRSFAFLFNNYTKAIPTSSFEQDPRYFYNIVDEAYARMQGVIGTISSYDPKCLRTPGYSSGTVEKDDTLKYTEIRSTIYAVLDHSGSIYDLEQQKQFLAKMVEEIHVSPSGSRLGLFDGNSGYMLINPNLTDIGSRLACNIMAIPNQLKSQNLPQAINTIRGELEKRLEEERRSESRQTAVPTNGVIILIMVEGLKIQAGNAAAIKNSLTELQTKFGGARVIFASRKYQQSDFNGIALDPARDFMKIQSTSQNLTDGAAGFVNDLRKSTTGQLTYPRCHSTKYDQEGEHRIATDFFITPDHLQYYEISPDYFYSARKLLLRFTSEYGKVRICESRSVRQPNSKNTGNCWQTKGSYAAPGSAVVDVELTYEKPCGKHGDRAGCTPIYLSFTPTEIDTSASVIRDCAKEGCETKNDVRVTFTHWDMRCNGALGMITVSLPLAILASIISLFTWRTST